MMKISTTTSTITIVAMVWMTIAVIAAPIFMMDHHVVVVVVVDATTTSSSASTGMTSTNNKTRMTSKTTAFITNNSNDPSTDGTTTKTTTITNKNPMQQWLNQLTTSNSKAKQQQDVFFQSLQQQLHHTQFNVQLDLETMFMVPSSSSSSSSAAATAKLHQNDPPPRLPIRNLIFELSMETTTTTTDSTDYTMDNDDSDNVNDIGTTNSCIIDATPATTTVEYSTVTDRAVTSIISKAKKDIKQTISSIPTVTIPKVPLPGSASLSSSSSASSSAFTSTTSSSTALPLRIQNSGEYITLDRGVQSLPIGITATATFGTPSWEIIWKDITTSPYGTIVCGFVIDQSISRTINAMIPPGILYLSFPIWKGTDLEQLQEQKVQYDQSCKVYAKERDGEIKKMMETSNVFAKMVHYKNALDAAENYMYLNHLTYKHVPSTTQDLIPVMNDAVESSSSSSTSTTTTTTPTRPEYYIVPKGMVRMIPFLPTELSLSGSTSRKATSTSTTMNQRILSLLTTAIPPSSRNNGKTTLHTKKDILFGSATIKQASRSE